MFWQSGEPRNSTHLAAAGLFFEPTQMESARPLYMLARLPLGPAGVGATPVSMPLALNIAADIQEPLVTNGVLAGGEDVRFELWPVTAATDGM